MIIPSAPAIPASSELMGPHYALAVFISVFMIFFPRVLMPSSEIQKKLPHSAIANAIADMVSSYEMQL